MLEISNDFNKILVWYYLYRDKATNKVHLLNCKRSRGQINGCLSDIFEDYLKGKILKINIEVISLGRAKEFKEFKEFYEDIINPNSIVWIA